MRLSQGCHGQHHLGPGLVFTLFPEFIYYKWEDSKHSMKCKTNQILSGQVVLWDASSQEQPVSDTASVPQQGLAGPNACTPQSNPGYIRQCAFWYAFLVPSIWALAQWTAALPLPFCSSRYPAQNVFWSLPLLSGACHPSRPRMSLHFPEASLPQPPQITVIITGHSHGAPASSLKFTKH